MSRKGNRQRRELRRIRIAEERVKGWEELGTRDRTNQVFRLKERRGSTVVLTFDFSSPPLIWDGENPVSSQEAHALESMMTSKSGEA